MRFVIIGNGVAGVTTARFIARDAPKGSEIHMYSDEPYLYYQRPKLPAFLAGDASMEELVQYLAAWYEERGIQVHLNTPVESIHLENKALYLHDGTTAPYDRLLLAHGSRANVPPIQGTQKAGVFTLRTLTDALAIKKWAENAGNAVVIGGGLLGLEAARGLSKLVPTVTVMEIFPRLLPRQLDEEGAQVLQRQIEGMGIRVRVDTVVEEVIGDDSVAGVRLKDGETLPADMVLISAGIRSNIELAQEAGLSVNRAVVVDETLRTSAEGVWAIGDVAEFQGRVWGIIPAAIEQARVAAANLVAPAGETPATYKDIVPSNTLKVMGIDLTSIGNVNPEGTGYQQIRRLDDEAGIYEKLVLQDGKIVGAILLGDKTRVTPITKLISAGADVASHEKQLLSDDFDIAALV